MLLVPLVVVVLVMLVAVHRSAFRR